MIEVDMIDLDYRIPRTSNSKLRGMEGAHIDYIISGKDPDVALALNRAIHHELFARYDEYRRLRRLVAELDGKGTHLDNIAIESEKEMFALRERLLACP